MEAITYGVPNMKGDMYIKNYKKFLIETLMIVPVTKENADFICKIKNKLDWLNALSSNNDLKINHNQPEKDKDENGFPWGSIISVSIGFIFLKNMFFD